MSWPSRRLLISLFVTLFFVAESSLHADERPVSKLLDSAGQYLDQREQEWFGFAKCISCHSGLPYALARPALRRLNAKPDPTEQELKLITQVQRRVENWKDLDSKEFGLYYDHSEEMKTQSWGTEAVFNAIILSTDDQFNGRSTPSNLTRMAFDHLWQVQVMTGVNRGSWEWLDFNEAPWGNQDARYFGASLAAIAVGMAPASFAAESTADTSSHIDLLRSYLKDHFSEQNLHNQAWGLWSSKSLGKILSPDQQTEVITQILEKQLEDGGWNLPSLGAWQRNDGTAQETSSDGYATGFALHVLQIASVPRSHRQIAKGLTWIERNQSPTGEWPSVSLVKKRDPTSHPGKFMSDAATAFIVLALDH